MRTQTNRPSDAFSPPGFASPWTRANPDSAPASAQEILLAPEETLIVDARASLRPAEVVEHKLRRLLRRASMGISFMRTESRLTRRGKS